MVGEEFYVIHPEGARIGDGWVMVSSYAMAHQRWEVQHSLKHPWVISVCVVKRETQPDQNLSPIIGVAE